MPRKDQHVVPHDGRWAVRSENAKRVTSTHKTQREAIVHARTLARSHNSELLIHGRDGRIRAKDSHGPDDFPPRG